MDEDVAMGRLFWLAGFAVLGAVAIGMNALPEEGTAMVSVSQAPTATARPEVKSEQFDFGTSSGSALSTAAFGLSALQPETFNGQIVLDIIEASPLDLGEKDRLIAKLIAAKSGRANLPRVLSDIRVSLAIE